MDEHAQEDLDKLAEEELRKKLRTQIIKAIGDKEEFNYLERLCEVNGLKCTMNRINYCLDEYLRFKKNGGTEFLSKYASMYQTCWKMFYEI